jgi:hypothetical protein
MRSQPPARISRSSRLGLDRMERSARRQSASSGAWLIGAKLVAPVLIAMPGSNIRIRDHRVRDRARRYLLRRRHRSIPSFGFVWAGSVRGCIARAFRTQRMLQRTSPGWHIAVVFDTARWSSFNSTTARGFEQLSWPQQWAIGHGQGDAEDRAFRGASLSFQIAQTES